MTDPAVHITRIAWRNGASRFLGHYGESGSDKLREAVTAYAADGGAAVVASTIVGLFGNSDSLSPEQLGELAETLVENYQP